MSEQKSLVADKTPLRKPRDRSLSATGIIATLAYLAFIAWYWHNSTHAIAALTPDTFGDFLSGTFAPLAFLWLVLGFFQQGEELRNSAQALWLQGKELQNSVEQQRELVSVTREQLIFDSQMLKRQEDELVRSSQPILRLSANSFSHVGPNQLKVTFELINHGRKCTDLIVVIGTEVVARSSLLEVGASVSFRRVLPVEGMHPFEMQITYVDERLQRQAIQIGVSGHANSPQFIESPFTPS